MKWGRQSRVRRWTRPMLMLGGFAVVMIAVARATYPQEGQQNQTASPAPPGEAEIRNLITAVTNAYNQADAKALAAQFTDNAALIDQAGSEVRGRDPIGQHYAKAFGDGPTCKISGEVEAVHILSPGVASAVGHFQLEDEKGEALSSGRYSLIALREGEQWRVAELRDDATATATDETSEKGAQIRELEWMVGDWVDEAENGKIATQVRWDEDENFLVRKYSVQIDGEPARSGTQWIGWDPQANQIRSWLFDSEGGFGEGQWTRSDNAWIIKASGVTGDGLTTSATQIVEPVNKDAVKFQSTDRVVGTEVLPDIDEALMVRKPPAPDPDRPTQPSESKTPAGASAPTDERAPAPDRP